MSMAAYLVTKYKHPIEAGDSPDPTVGDRDVLVDIHAAGLNLIDAKVRDGEFKVFLPYKSAVCPRARPRRRRHPRRPGGDALPRR